MTDKDLFFGFLMLFVGLILAIASGRIMALLDIPFWFCTILVIGTSAFQVGTYTLFGVVK